MNINDEQKEEKGGFWAALSGLFRGGSSVAGGTAPSGFGASGGLFASKAGIMGMVLGGATIAAGVGVIYNFVGSTSKPVYSPELFQNSFYEEESAAAGLKREQAKDRSSASASTLDMFSAQAKKDGLGGLAAEAGSENSQAAGEAAPGAEVPAAAGAAPAPEASGGAGGGAKLQRSAGFGGGGGSSSASSMPRLQSGGGLSSGIGGKFASMGLASAAGGKVSAMGGAAAARTKTLPKNAVPSFKRSSSLSQANHANARGNQAVYSAGATMRNAAEEAFSGETTGTGDVNAGPAGKGIGGEGLSTGAQLKANDPSLNSNKNQVPEPKDNGIKDVSPWNKIYSKMMKFGALALGAIILARIFGKLAKNSLQPYWYAAAMAACAAAMAFAALLFAEALKLMKGVSHKPPAATDWAGQPMIALPIMFVSVKLGIMAWDAACGLERGQGTAMEKIKVDGKLKNVPNGKLADGTIAKTADGTVIRSAPGNSFLKPSMQSGNWGLNKMFDFLK